MPLLALLPTQPELDACLSALATLGHRSTHTRQGRLDITTFGPLGIACALGGLGKAQFAVQAQHLLDCAPWPLLVCAGAAGALGPELRPGDVIVGTETIEHDIRKASRPLQPRFPGSPIWLERLRRLAASPLPCRLHFGPIASGDEDIVSPQRGLALREATGALAVGWEGAGGARAAAFSGVPFLEIRVIADASEVLSTEELQRRLTVVMPHLGIVLSHLASAGGLTTA